MSELPSPGAVLSLPDGRKIDPSSGHLIEDEIEIPSNVDAREFVAGVRRKLADLPDIPRRMNVISVIVSYALFGLDDDEIAVALQLPLEQVQNIKSLEAYDDMLRSVVESIKHTDTDDVTRVLQQGALNAAQKVVELVRRGEDDKVRLSAARDVLDRTNYRPKDVREIDININNTLLIERVTRVQNVDIPPIDVIDGDFTTCNED